MRMRLPFLAIAAVVALAAPARADLLIQIDKAAQQMTVSADGEVLYTWPVSTGIKRYDTPNGAYTPLSMEREHYSREWDDAPMPYSIFFTKRGHAIHGSYHSRLGQPASHGCVRLSVKNAATLWGLVRQHKLANTMVVLTGDIPPRGAPPLVAQRDRREQTAYADDDDDAPPPRYRYYQPPPRYLDARPYYPYRRYYPRYGYFPYFPFVR